MDVGQLIAENINTGLQAIYVGDDYITIFKNKISQRATTFKNAELMMNRYGKSKVMHWNDKCAKPNTNAKSLKVRMLDGLLEGCSVCLNCQGRTGYYQN